MLYKFKSKAAGDVIMMAPNGDAVLRLIGKEPSATGIIECAAMPAAMAAIEQAVASEESARKQAPTEAGESGKAGTAAEPAVSLRQRAWPLLDMMKRSHAAQADIVWGV